MPGGEMLKLPDGTAVPSACEAIESPDEWVAAAAVEEARWVLPGAPREDLLPRNLSPSAAAPVEGAKTGEIIELGERLEFAGVADMTALGEALHGIIAAEINEPKGDSANRAVRILMEWGFEGIVDAEAAHAAARRFVNWAQKNFEPIACYVEHPVLHRLPTGQIIQGSIDVLIEAQDGRVIVDHKSSPRPRTEWQKIAESYSGQLLAYKSAVDGAAEVRSTAVFIHYPVGGGAVGVTGLDL